MTKTVQVANKQSLLDISLQEYGNAKAIFDLALANNMGITDDLVASVLLDIVDSDKTDLDIVNFYKNRGIKPATALHNLPWEIVGIGIMTIESNIKPFKVS